MHYVYINFEFFSLFLEQRQKNDKHVQIFVNFCQQRIDAYFTRFFNSKKKLNKNHHHQGKLYLIKKYYKNIWDVKKASMFLQSNFYIFFFKLNNVIKKIPSRKLLFLLTDLAFSWIEKWIL